MPLDSAPADPDQDADVLEGEDDPLYCAQCGAFVTRARWASAEKGGHEHVVFNPAGHLFRIRCFSEAPGALPVGRASGEFTWFPGTQWRVAVCIGCMGHLGWAFARMDGGASFLGLIDKALTASPS